MRVSLGILGGYISGNVSHTRRHYRPQEKRRNRRNAGVSLKKRARAVRVCRSEKSRRDERRCRCLSERPLPGFRPRIFREDTRGAEFQSPAKAIPPRPPRLFHSRLTRVRYGVMDDVLGNSRSLPSPRRFAPSQTRSHPPPL